MKSKGPVVRNYGGAYQLRIETPEDLKTVLDLDEARWVATSAPIDGLNCDPQFLQYADRDGNGRVRTDEIRTAISWMLEMLSDTSGLADDSDALPLDAVDTSHAAGRMLRAGAVRILRNLGREETGEIVLSDVRDRQTILANAAANGDGVIPPEACEGEDLAQFVRDILDTVGGQQDASGEMGINLGNLNNFLAEAAGYLEWNAGGKIPSGHEGTDVMVWGPATPAAFGALQAVRGKLDEYFSLCKLIQFEPNLKSAVGLSEAEIQGLDAADAATMETKVRKGPLAAVEADCALDFKSVINPYYAGPLAAFREKVAAPAIGKGDKLKVDGWEKIKAIFEPYRAWVEGKKGGVVEKLGEEKLRAYLGSDFADRVKVFIDADAAVADEVAEVAKIEKLILYRKWLMELANNIVSMPRLYHPEARALFQMGSLIMDGRQFEFNVRVTDRAQHKKIAESSGTFLMYVEITGKEGTDERFEVATPVTSGDAGNLGVSKRGIFFTTDEREWDARVVDVIRRPISLLEAVKAPFVSIGSLIGRQVEKITGAKSADLDAKVQKQMEAVRKAPAQPASSSGSMMGALMGGGVAISALGASFAFITKQLSGVNPVHVLVVLLVAVAAVLLPVIILGIVRLRRRDMAHILEASGWALNARLRITGGLGRLLTFRPSFPPGAVRERTDLVKSLAKQAGRRRGPLRWILGVVAALVLGLIVGYLLGQWLHLF